ncbi:MAG: hypothetical protein GX221_08350 [Candidatus Riflebacteria bacterium]|nr:hypothetical protein [Candidatus Riflebacteria bacterium]
MSGSGEIQKKTFRLTMVVLAKPNIYMDAISVTIPAWHGYMGFLCDRAPIIALMTTGIISITAKSGDIYYYATTGGIARFTDNNLVILCDTLFTEEETVVLAQKYEQLIAEGTIPPVPLKEVVLMTEEEKKYYVIGKFYERIKATQEDE